MSNGKSLTMPAKWVRHQDTGLSQTVEQSAELATASAQSKEQAEIQSAILIAKRMPRNEAEAFQKLTKSCQRPSFADAASYVFPRGGKDITGPSVYLAREAARVWGNIRYGLKVLRDDEQSRTISGWAWDLETNSMVEAEDHFEKLIQRKNAATKQTEWIEPDERDLRELTNRRGAILVRNCILQIIPSDLTDDALFLCDQTLADKAKADPDATKKRLLVDFGAMHITVGMLEGVLGHSFDQSSPEELTKLRAVLNSIQSGNSTWKEYAAESSKEAEAESAADLNARLASQRESAETPDTGSPTTATPDVSDAQWASLLTYLDNDPVRVRIKNKAKAAIGMLAKDALLKIDPAKRTTFIREVVRLGKADHVHIEF